VVQSGILEGIRFGALIALFQGGEGLDGRSDIGGANVGYRLIAAADCCKNTADNAAVCCGYVAVLPLLTRCCSAKEQAIFKDLPEPAKIRDREPPLPDSAGTL